MNREGRHITEEELKQIQEIQVDLLTGCTSVGTELSGRTDLFKRAVLFLDASIGRAFIARSL